jgi:hypothetical protein
VLLPLVFLLPLLLLFKQNRCTAAWIIWAPVTLTVFLAAAFVLLLMGGEKDFLCAFSSHTVGLAAVWLLSPYLKNRRALLAFAKTLLVLALFSVLAFCPRLLGASSGWLDFRLYLLVALAVAAFPAALALVLGGRFVRRLFGRLRYLAWVAVWLFVGWNLCALPFVLFDSGKTETGEYVLGLLMIWGVAFGLMLPLLLFSVFNSFYQARLRAFSGVLEQTSTVPSPVLEGVTAD